jgi:hypothetical protein
MTTPTDPGGQSRPARKRQIRIVLLILLIAIALDKYAITGILPPGSTLISLNPMLVFLDIPVDCP